MTTMVENTISANTTIYDIIEQYKSLLMEADRLFQDYINTHSLKVACGPACTDCCIYDVPANIIDAYTFR